MSLKFWRSLRQWVQRHEREAFLEARRMDLKCPHCNTWTSACEKESALNNFGHQLAVRYICGQCDRDSYWVCEAGFWLKAEDLGISLESIQQASKQKRGEEE